MEKHTYDNDDWIQITVRGQLFEIERSLLQKFPGALLAQLNTSHPHYSKSGNKYIFNRDPVIFNCVVNYYVTGKYICLSIFRLLPFVMQFIH